MISKALQEKILQQAFRCPSVHNVQPWLLKVNSRSLIVYDNLDRTLNVGDPQLHDHEVSMGAFVEGLDLILGTEGLRIAEIKDLELRKISYKNYLLRERFELILQPGAVADSLAAEIPRRRSYRGVFPKNSAEDRRRLEAAMNKDHSAVITSLEELKTWARIYDQSALRGNSQGPYQEELYHWLRLTENHPRYQEDGLNREALSLSAMEGFFANTFMKPSVYKKLNQWGLAKYLVSEAPQIRSATGLVFIFKPDGATAFEAGRLFYRLWLELTREGFSACPLSSLVDDSEARKKLMEKFNNKTPLNVLRVGRAPQKSLYTSPRLPLKEKIISENEAGVIYED